MGLLDDAIKEHIELKRKHGAAEEELRRQEAEALGPARRDFAQDPAAAVEPEPAPDAAPVPSDDAGGDYEPAAPAGWLDEEPDGEPFAEVAPAAAPAEPLEHAAEAADPVPAQDPLPAPELEEEPESEPEPERAAAPEPAARREEPVRSQTPTEGFPALSRDDEASTSDDADEDVLEETPDFLQDTPEHDRLWFEQKPPRDFDFDG